MDISNFLIAATEAAGKQAKESAGFVGTLGLNWKLFLAQAVNFGIVVFVLWKWVLGPVGKGLEERRERIAKSLKDAEEVETRLREAEAQYESRITEARKEAGRMMEETKLVSEKLKAEIIESGKTEAAKLTEHGRKAIEAEKEEALREIREAAAELVAVATEKVIREKLDEARDRKLIEEALTSLNK